MKHIMKAVPLMMALVANSVYAGECGAHSASRENTCNLWQVCQSNVGKCPGHRWTSRDTCDDASLVSIPEFIENGYPPVVLGSLTNTLGTDALATACPYIDLTQPLCCNQDNAQIMEFNYQQLDAVFASDCPICAVNLKRMWCEYACNPNKSNWLFHHGDVFTTAEGTTEAAQYTNIQVFIDSDYACGIYQSCAKESYIAQAGISSAIAFLDFMGSNGAPYSLSFINFTLTTNSTVDNALQGLEDQAWWPCDYAIPASDPSLLGYTGLLNTTCSFCDAACTPPVVDDSIGFLDGLSWQLVGWTYGSFILFTIIFQVVVWLCCEKQMKAKLEAKIQAFEEGTYEGHNSSNGGRPGKPLNVNATASHNNSDMVDKDRLEDSD